jgi:hypothetical protein
MSRVKNPEEKKRLSLERDHRNASGEPPKAWRKQKPLKKAKSRRAFRKASNDLLQITLDESDAPRNAVRKSGSVKQAHIIDWGPVRLGSHVAGRLAHRQATVGARKRRKAKAQGGE